MDGSDTPLLLERRGGVALFTVNRPRVLNALDQAMAEALLAAAREIEGDEGVRAVVIRGAGRAFMAGGDIAAFQAAGSEAPAVIGRLIDPFHAALRILATMPKPVLVAVHGAVAGAGLSLMLSADLAIAAQGTQFTLAYTRLGASADGGASWSLPRIVGLRKAMEIAMLNQPIDAAEALRLSLVNKVVPTDAFDTEVETLAARLAQGPTFAFGAMKRLLRTSFDHDLATQLDAEAESFKACAGTDDFREGVEAFMTKRAARFVGR